MTAPARCCGGLELKKKRGCFGLGLKKKRGELGFLLVFGRLNHGFKKKKKGMAKEDRFLEPLD